MDRKDITTTISKELVFAGRESKDSSTKSENLFKYPVVNSQEISESIKRQRENLKEPEIFRNPQWPNLNYTREIYFGSKKLKAFFYTGRTGGAEIAYDSLNVDVDELGIHEQLTEQERFDYTNEQISDIIQDFDSRLMDIIEGKTATLYRFVDRLSNNEIKLSELIRLIDKKPSKFLLIQEKSRTWLKL